MNKLKCKIITLILSTVCFTNISFANESEALKQSKLIGQNRYETNIKVSKEGWDYSDEVILVNSDSMSDALAATPLASIKDAPILLTEKNKILKETINEMKRLNTENITLIGSESSISTGVYNELKKQGYKVERIGGNDRVSTSLNIANEISEDVVVSAVVVVNGYKGLADATGIASIAGSSHMPILYTNGQNLNGIKRYIENNALNVHIIGSYSSISKDVDDEIKRSGIDVSRLGGVDRKDTNAKVLNKFYDYESINKVYVVKDGSYKDSELVDGLAVGVLAAKSDSPVLLANNGINQAQMDYLMTKYIDKVIQVGGGANEKSFNDVYNIAKNPPANITNKVSNYEKSKMEGFLDIFIADYVRLLEYDRNNIDKGQLLEFVFNRAWIKGELNEMTYLDWNNMFYSTLNIDYINNDLKNLLGVDIGIKKGESYSYEKFEDCISTFKVENNKVRRHGTSEERGSVLNISKIRDIYELESNIYKVKFEEYWSIVEDQLESEGVWYEAIIKKLPNGKFNLISIK